MRRVRALLLLLVVGGVAAPAAAASMPTAQVTTAAYARVGVVFVGTRHGCTGTVVHSEHRNLVLTAAHCLHGAGSTLTFAPGYEAGRSPYGRWGVSAVFADARWRHDRDQHDDFALLRIAPRDGRRIEDVLGGFPLGRAPQPGTPVDVAGYNHDSGSQLECRTSTYLHGAYPAFDCHGYVDGSSGSPLLVRGADGRHTVRGAIGGLHFGGCTESTSYSAPFGDRLLTLKQRAQAAVDGDWLPRPGPSGC